MRLIDADALIDTIQRFFNGDALEYTANSMSGKDVVELLRSEPMANVVGGWHDARKELPKPRHVIEKYLIATVHSDGSIFYSLELYQEPADFEQRLRYDIATGEQAYGVDYWAEISPPEVRE